MGSTNNTWIEPIGYTSSFRPVRTPLRLNYGRDDAKIKETRGQKFRNQNKGRESTHRTFPMELRPREVIIPEVVSSKKSKYSRSRSTPREGPREVIIPEVVSSKKSKYSRSRSTPREGPRKVIIPEVVSSKKSKHSRSRSTPKEGPREVIIPEVVSSKKSKYSRSRSTPREVKSTPKNRTSTPNRAPPGYIHSSLSASNRAPPGYIHASSNIPNRAPSSYGDSKSGGLKYEQRRPGKRNLSPTSFNSRYHRNNDEDTPRRFLRSRSEPPRRSARIANLQKKSDTHQGVKNEQKNSARPRAISRAVSRARDSSPRGSRSQSKYKTSRTDYRSSSVAPSKYSSGNSFTSISRELQNRVSKKERRHPHRSSTSLGQRSTVSPNERNNEPQQEYDQSTNWSASVMSYGSPSAIAERSPGYPHVSTEDTDPSYQENIENDVVDIVNRMEDVCSNYNTGLDEYQEGRNPYLINSDSLFSRREPSNYVNDTNAYRNNEYFSPHGLLRNCFACHDNSREGFDSMIPFHRRQMDVHESSNNTSAVGIAQYETSLWQAAYSDYLSPSEYAHHQISSWQTAYNERLLMQNNVWNNNVFSSTQILCPDGGVLCVNENIYCLNRRVSLNNENEN